ncbi:aminotransferase class I/II-fold pyridoxal phosphate-dependent enzyme [Hydrogenothermus marinus]|uniref:Glycine C-acetyltransferase/8-amino-7-oxononanoate synthase n=1 Tax=Hydrogenothermus marinus TaxID=133270 RepID=A0A3M0BQ53_9AQUI|nr:pyridoxal phosphate-dependent aminotransferase family protein [Hydrogenothermus marinus]RMA93052.1 glycine C-acetyltransferase/8-amino-7-oxononanoate synthase [Hydrogenothermus marinus]
MMNFEKFLLNSLKSLEIKELKRNRLILKENIINFSSNDYLGLKDNPITKENLCKNIKNLSLGSGASTHISGYTEIQKKLEEKLSSFKETENCIVVGSGYLANVGLISAITTEKDIIFSDSLNHASIIDGIRLSKAKKVIYKHNNIEDLEEKIKKEKVNGNRFIITDGVFSMEGDIAKLDKLYEIAEKYDAVLIIDDAHSTGILGEGKGSLFHFGLKPNKRVVQMGTLSKAVGSYGSFICGTNLLIDYLVNKMRTAIFTTALSPIQNFISLENLKILINQPERRKDVLQKAKYLYEKLKEREFNIKYYGVPIISLILNTPERAIYYRDKLLEKGFFVQAIRPPTVPEGECRLRITLSYNHKYEEIENLIKALKEVQDEEINRKN